jgi:hypothetical protein
VDHDLVKVRAEDRKQVEADVNGRRYRQRDGYFHMKPEDASYHLKVGNLPSPSAALPVGRAKGYRCTACGFGSFFVTCSQCGGRCEREALT